MMVPSAAEPRIFNTKDDAWITVPGVTMRRSRSWWFSLHALHTSSGLGLEFQTCVLLLHKGGKQLKSGLARRMQMTRDSWLHLKPFCEMDR